MMDTIPLPAAVAADAAPDWATLSDEVQCPMCGYNLYGLSEPRCPECGYQFTWREILDARRRPHPFLFEHHPEANARSFGKTARASLRPRRFWRELHPAMPSSPARLKLYWAIAVAVLLVGYAAQCAQPVVKFVELRRGPPPMPWGGFFDAFPNMAALGTGLVIAAAWPWMTYAVLLIFQGSMRRARVRKDHVLRCVMYCFADLGVWIGLMMVVVAAGRAVVGIPFEPSFWFTSRMAGGWIHPDDGLVTAGSIVAMCASAFAAWRLGVAYRQYLQFRHAAGVALASQVIVALAVVFLILHTVNPLEGAFYEWIVALMR